MVQLNLQSVGNAILPLGPSGYRGEEPINNRSTVPGCARMRRVTGASSVGRHEVGLMTNHLSAPSDPEAPGDASVRFALFKAASLMMAPRSPSVSAPVEM